MVDFAVLEPEIDSALIYIGAGSAPVLQAATHFHNASDEITRFGHRLACPVARLGGA